MFEIICLMLLMLVLVRLSGSWPILRRVVLSPCGPAPNALSIYVCAGGILSSSIFSVLFM